MRHSRRVITTGCTVIPLFFSASERERIMFATPRILKEPVFCKCSIFKNTWQFSFLISEGEFSTGVIMM